MKQPLDPAITDSLNYKVDTLVRGATGYRGRWRVSPSLMEAELDRVVRPVLVRSWGVSLGRAFARTPPLYEALVKGGIGYETSKSA